MLIDNPAEIRSGGPLLFLFKGNIFHADAPQCPDEGSPEDVFTLHTPSRIFNLIAEANGSNVRAVFIAAPPSLTCIAGLQESINPGDFIAFEQTDDSESDYETQKLYLQSVATAIKAVKGAHPLFLTNYTISKTVTEKHCSDQSYVNRLKSFLTNYTISKTATEKHCSDQSYVNRLKSINSAIKAAAKVSGTPLCDIEHSFAITNRALAQWGSSLMRSDGITPNVFGNICLAVLLYRTVADSNPNITRLGEMLERAWFHIRGADNIPLHFRADKFLPILAQIGDHIFAASHAHSAVNDDQKQSVGSSMICPLPSATQRIQCAPMSRNGVHLLMGILSHLGGFCHFGKLELHYEKRDGLLHLNDVGRKFVTTFATDMSLYDGRVEAEIPLRVEFSHRLTESLFKEKWIRCVRDPRDMLVSIHDLAPVKKLDAKVAPIEETLEVPLPNAGGCLFGLGPIEEWALQESFLHHVVESDQLCHVRFEHIKSDGITEISRLLKFIGYSAKLEHIEEALLANKVEAVRPFGKISQSGGKVGHWRSREFATLLDRRYSLVAQVLPNPHDYTFEASIPKPVLWPSNIFTEARNGWVIMTLHNLKKRFPSARYELFREPLMNFTQLAGDIPLLEIQLAEILLVNGSHVSHAKEVLEKWANSPLWSPRFMALMALAKHDAEFKRRLEISFVEAQSIWRRTKHPLIRQAASRMGFVDEDVLAAYDKSPISMVQ